MEVQSELINAQTLSMLTKAQSDALTINESYLNN